MDTTTTDLAPAATALARVVAGIRDEQLSGPTPCADTPVAGLLDHLVTMTDAFRLKAEKRPTGAAPPASAVHLPADRRTRVPAQLEALVTAWQDPAAHEGTTTAGGVAVPGSVAALVVLDELVVHGWDLAVATGQPHDVDDVTAAACLGVVRWFTAGPGARLFGPAVPVPADAPAPDRLLGATGRDPTWRPPG